MVLFWPIQQELNCINDSGDILGKIKFDSTLDLYGFYPESESTVLSNIEESNITERLAGLNSGKYSIPAQDDD